MQQQVTALMKEAEEKLAHYLHALEQDEPFDMNGFDALVAEIQKQILALPKGDAASFEGQVGGIMDKLNRLATGLEARRASVQQEIEGLSHRQKAQSAYLKADDTK